MAKTAFYVSKDYQKHCTGGGNHPYWNWSRISVVFQLPKMLGWHDSGKLAVREASYAPFEMIALIHSSQYIETLQRLSQGQDASGWAFGFGTGDCPIFQGVHEASSLIVGATVDAMHQVVTNDEIKNAMTFLGGLHHAHPTRASGFCYYNDPAIAIKKYREKFNGKVLYLDTDCHHGDGVQDIFYNDPNVLTISIHELSTFFFPGTGYINETGTDEGEGFSVNIPVPPGTYDDAYYKAFQELVPPIWRRFDPDIVFWQCGSDTHEDDPITHLQLTNNVYRKIAQDVNTLVKEGKSEGKLIAMGGGGYDPVATAKAWSTVLATIADIEIPSTLPQTWIDYCQQEHNISIFRSNWWDKKNENPDMKNRIDNVIDEIIEKVKEIVFPYFAL
ncbi:MAG: acetoin utilization protein AcuC [Candidatus Hermodarchaeota archaeon]